MIITRLSGGLGNQMFQYATARALASRNKTSLYLDISSYTSDYHKNAPRTFELDQFNIQADIAQLENFKTLGIPNSLSQKLQTKIKRRLYKMIEKLKPLYKRKYILEKTYNFSPEVYRAGPDCFLSGVWQSEKYFKDIENIIKKEFILKNEPLIITKNLIEAIETCNSVSLHIRRGDYVSDKKTNQFHGSCPAEYYEKAIQIVSEKVPDPTFFIFSDDMEWAKNNLKINYQTNFVSDKNIPDYEEIIIMSKCKHNIIANSSFSWWGAWLNENKSKIVIAPQKWFSSDNIDTKDLIPQTWTRL